MASAGIEHDMRDDATLDRDRDDRLRVVENLLQSWIGVLSRYSGSAVARTRHAAAEVSGNVALHLTTWALCRRRSGRSAC
jgi:hypothetical protein